MTEQTIHYQYDIGPGTYNLHNGVAGTEHHATTNPDKVTCEECRRIIAEKVRKAKNETS